MQVRNTNLSVTLFSATNNTFLFLFNYVLTFYNSIVPWYTPPFYFQMKAAVQKSDEISYYSFPIKIYDINPQYMWNSLYI